METFKIYHFQPLWAPGFQTGTINLLKIGGTHLKYTVDSGYVESLGTREISLTQP